MIIFFRAGGLDFATTTNVRKHSTYPPSTSLSRQQISHPLAKNLDWQDTLPTKLPSWPRGYPLGRQDVLLASGAEQSHEIKPPHSAILFLGILSDQSLVLSVRLVPVIPVSGWCLFSVFVSSARLVPFSRCLSHL
jgi:hypothetical protein